MNSPAWIRVLGWAALLSHALTLSAANERSKTENVILITTDGLRWQEVFTGADPDLMNKTNGGVKNVPELHQTFWRDTAEARREALLPFFWSFVAKRGHVFGNTNKGSVVRVTNGKNFSYPGYNELLAGFGDPAIDSNAKRPNRNVTVLEWLHGQPAFRGRVAAFCSWDVFPFIINRERSGVLVNAGLEPLPHRRLTSREMALNQFLLDTTPPWDGIRHDSFTHHAALEHLRARKPRVLYVAYDETDDWAHDGRYDRYLQAARRVDGFVKELWDAAQSMSAYRDKTSFIITTDHGRGNAPTGWKDHGDQAGSEFIWLAVFGPDTPERGERENVPPLTQGQVAATVAALLGEDFCAAVPQAAGPVADVLPPGWPKSVRKKR